MPTPSKNCVPPNIHKQRGKARIGLILGAIVVLGVAAYAINRMPSTAPSTPKSAGAAPGKAGGPPGGFAMAVETAVVEAIDLLDEGRAVGTLKSNESVVLRPEVAGRISALGFRDGSRVSKGTLLIALDATTQQAELAQAKANLALARSNFGRNEDLLAKKFVSQQALDAVAATLKVQEAQVQLAEAKLAKTRISAPFSGVIGIRNVSVGDYVKEGQELVNLEDVATLKVDFRLPENDLARLKKGQSLVLTSDALPGEQFDAVLDAIDPLVDAGGRAISCRARLINSGDKLKPGMFVRVQLAYGERKGALMIPEQAVVTGAKPSVYVVVDGKAKQVPVQLGSRQSARVEIVEGLKAGDVVVTAGQMKLREGAPVRAVGVAAEKPAQTPEVKAAPGQGKS